jgi:hypothetical protein
MLASPAPQFARNAMAHPLKIALLVHLGVYTQERRSILASNHVQMASGMITQPENASHVMGTV